MNQRIVSAAQRRSEIGIAALFLITAITSITGEILLAPILNAPDLLSAVFSNQTMVITGAVLWSINNIGIVYIAVFAFPLISTRSPVTALGYLVSRVIEGTVMMVGIAALLALVFLSQATNEAGTASEPWAAVLGQLLKQVKVLGISQISLPLLGLGGLMFTGYLVQYRLVPRFISWTGVVGYALVFFGGVATWFGVLDASPGGASTFMAVPVAVFEILMLPPWLLWRGLNDPTTGDVSK